MKENGIQKQARQSRISSYIAVPPAKLSKDPNSTKLEQPSFAISITLLTPGLNVPYSAPEATPEDPFPRSRIVGGLPGSTSERGRYDSVIPPYVPQTTSPNETIAAYIYFDGRPKEEVATLLRRGEETWVNSRWVSVPESEGGGLAEREFLFREVGLERWLNGLDLEGSKDKAARIEKRQRKLEKKRRKKSEQLDSDDDNLKIKREDGEDVMHDDANLSSSDSDDEPPMPEAAGQIKVALFRVLASGEIKKGEYSPQFDAHDDDEGGDQNGNGNGGGDEDIDHTTSFAKPKTLDPRVSAPKQSPALILRSVHTQLSHSSTVARSSLGKWVSWRLLSLRRHLLAPSASRQVRTSPTWALSTSLELLASQDTVTMLVPGKSQKTRPPTLTLWTVMRKTTTMTQAWSRMRRLTPSKRTARCCHQRMPGGKARSPRVCRKSR